MTQNYLDVRVTTTVTAHTSCSTLRSTIPTVQNSKNDGKESRNHDMPGPCSCYYACESTLCDFTVYGKCASTFVYGIWDWYVSSTFVVLTHSCVERTYSTVRTRTHHKENKFSREVTRGKSGAGPAIARISTVRHISKNGGVDVLPHESRRGLRRTRYSATPNLI